MQDTEWLREYAESGSEASFARVVSLHADLVFSAAMRHVRDRQLAEEVAQVVFLRLALNARAGRMHAEIVLSAWLLGMTRYASLDIIKSEARRKRREQKAARMAGGRGVQRMQTVTPLGPELDAAIAKLQADDRRAIVLRFFECRSIAEVATTFGISSDAARQRVHRALERLRSRLAGRTWLMSAPALGEAIRQGAIQPAPPHLAARCTSAAITRAVPAPKRMSRVEPLSRPFSPKFAVAATFCLVAVAYCVYSALPTESGKAPLVADAEALDRPYALAPGEILRYLPPPHGPERQAYWFSQPPPGGNPLARDAALTFEWDGRLRWTSYAMSSHSLSGVIQAALAFRPYEFGDWDARELATPFPGDWVVRAKTSHEERLAALGQLVFTRTGKRLRFEKRRVEREVIFVTGRLRNGGPDNELPQLAGPVLDIFGDDRLPPAEAPPLHGTLGGLLRLLETSLREELVDQTGASASSVAWRDHRPRSNRAHQVLSNLARQCPLHFSYGKRACDMWFVAKE